MKESARSRQAEHQLKLVGLGLCQRCQHCRGCGTWEPPLDRARHQRACDIKAKYARLCVSCMVPERARQAKYRFRKAQERARVELRKAARRAKRGMAVRS